MNTLHSGQRILSYPHSRCLASHQKSLSTRGGGGGGRGLRHIFFASIFVSTWSWLGEVSFVYMTDLFAGCKTCTLIHKQYIKRSKSSCRESLLPTSVDSGGTYARAFPITGHPLSWEIWRTLFHAFPHNIHPFSMELFPIYPLSREYYGDPYSLLFAFLRAREICVLILPLPSTTDMRCNKGPIPSPWEAIECSGKYVYIHHKSYPLFLNFSESFGKTRYISGAWFKNTNFPGFSWENLPETNGQNSHLCRENENAHAAPLYNIHSSGGGVGVPLSPGNTIKNIDKTIQFKHDSYKIWSIIILSTYIFFHARLFTTIVINCYHSACHCPCPKWRTQPVYMKNFIAEWIISILVNVRYLRLKLLKYKDNNKKIINTVDNNFNNISLYMTYIMSEVSFERHYFVYYYPMMPFIRTSTFSQMALNPFCDENLHI